MLDRVQCDTNIQAELVAGHTVHRRHGPIQNTFRYGVDYMLFRFSQSGTANTEPSRLVSRNRFNAFAYHDRDHGGVRGQGKGPEWVRETLVAHGLGEISDGVISLIAQPRVFGFLFNPVSFWLIEKSGALRGVIAEVNNTFGDRHCYLCHHDDLSPIKSSDKLAARKVFHVSPFQPREGTYSFRFLIDADRIGIWIDYRHDDGGVYATITGRRQPASSLALCRSLIRRPFGSLRVLALIHFQALKLWLGGAQYRRRPQPPAQGVTR